MFPMVPIVLMTKKERKKEREKDGYFSVVITSEYEITCTWFQSIQSLVEQDQVKIRYREESTVTDK